MTREVVIARLWDETSEIRCFELRPADGGPLPPAEPGAHIEVHLKPGLVRHYSLCNGPEQKESYLIGVKREPQSRGGSSAMHGLPAGARLTISAPRNNFPLAVSDGPSLLLAGGIGITPLLSMARHLKALGRPWHLHLFARSRALAPFASVLAESRDATIHLELVPPALDDVLRGLLADPEPEKHLYICGPGPFMDLACRIARERDWQDTHVHLEYFSGMPVAADSHDDAFELVAQRSGKTMVVRGDQTILQALCENGVELLTSCEQGVCGTCVTTVLEGEPDHRDRYFNAAERASGKVITPCVSRCKGRRLVLDL